MIHDQGYEVETLAASRSPYDFNATVLTLRVRFPRIVLAELNTHRWLSRNSASSRAVPVAKMLEQIRKDPAMPARFGANQPGMQDKGGEHNQYVQVPEELRHAFYAWDHMLDEDTPISGDIHKLMVDPRALWRFTAWMNSLVSESYSDAGFHKQIANRWTEPAQWMNTIVSATTQGWIDVLKLRDHEAADPTIAKLAELIRIQRDATEYVTLKPGEWHLPYILNNELELPLREKLVYSTARIARVSIAPFDGEATWEKEKARHDLLVGSDPIHASPTEHPCTPMPGRWGNFEGFAQYRQVLERKINANALT